MEKGKRKSMEIPESICRVLERVKSVFREKPEVYEIFENCYTDTLRTAVKHLEDGSVYVVTGDIPAMWLQLEYYVS